VSIFLKLAWRNIWRNSRRSLLTLTAIAFAVFVAETMKGMQVGTFEFNIEHTLRFFSGYLQIQREEYSDFPSPSKSFRVRREISAALDREKDVVGYAPRITGSALVGYKGNSYGAMLIGVSPHAEEKTFEFTKRIVTGRFLQNDTSAEVVLGEGLMRNLHARIGEKIVILAQGRDGSMGNMKFKIVGAVRMGSSEIDKKILFIGIAAANEMLAMHGAVSYIAVRLSSLGVVGKVQKRLQEKLNDTKLRVLSWKEIIPQLEETLQMKAAGTFLIELILFIIVGFGILNTLLMSVMERHFEFGISLSIGMKNGKLASLIFLEFILLLLVGLFAGNVVGYLLNYYLSFHPIVMGSAMRQMYEHYGFLPFIYSSAEPRIFFNITFVITIIALFAALYPVWKVLKLEPLKGIRYT
jgi:ABC-type lipoprotein release transport system permease subunit